MRIVEQALRWEEDWWVTYAYDGEESKGELLHKGNLELVQMLEQKLLWDRERVQVLGQEIRRDGLILGLLSLVIGISLLFLLRLRNATSISLTGQLICFIPEECVAELGVQHSRLIKRRIPIWKVRLMMLGCVLGLMWAFYIQINIENLGLPRVGGRGSIDD